jgi:hypothetical protein
VHRGLSGTPYAGRLIDEDRIDTRVRS